MSGTIKFRRYYDLESIARMQHGGRELLDKDIYMTEKRDGENVPIWLTNFVELDSGAKPSFDICIASHNNETASPDIVARLKATPEYDKIVKFLLNERKNYDGEFIAYGELLKTESPTRIEPRRKKTHWILFDVLDVKTERWMPYEWLHERAYEYKIPLVRCFTILHPMDMAFLFEQIEDLKKFCRRHRREGVVGKVYHGEQVMFKEKISLPTKLPKIRQEGNTPLYPPMPNETVNRAVLHAIDVVGKDNWKDVKKAMPELARQLETEAREHLYEPPPNFFKIYTDTPVEKIRTPLDVAALKVTEIAKKVEEQVNEEFTKGLGDAS